MQLREYQKEALDTILREKRGIIVLPTGAGKTLIGVALLKYLQQQYDEVEYYVLVPTLALVKQWYTVLMKNHVSFVLGNVMTYASFISLSKRTSHILGQRTILSYAKTKASHVTVIIVDEAHHAHISAKLWEAISKANPDYLVGFTATPNPYRQYDLQVIYRRSITDLARYLADLEIRRVNVNLSSEDKQAFLLDVAELGRLFDERNRAIKHNNLKKLEQIDEMIDAVLLHMPYLIALDPNVENKTVDVAVELYSRTKERILIKTQRRSAAGDIRDGIKKRLGMTDEDILIYKGKQDVDKLYNQNWKILIALKALSEGIDIPDLSYAILSSYDYGNIIGIVQTIGRTLRRTPTKTKAVVYILVPDVPQYDVAYKRLLKYIESAEAK